jgi:uncharacterized protein (TIGR03546 family)
MKQIIKTITFLMSNDSPEQMGWGISIAILYSMMPGFNLLHLLIIFLVLILKVHLAGFLLFSFLFNLINYQLMYKVSLLGEYLLTQESLKNFWTLLYNTPIVPFTRFNNTAVMGGFLLGIILLIPSKLLFTKLIILYRKKYQTKINAFFSKLKIVKILKTSKIYKIYAKYRAIRKLL